MWYWKLVFVVLLGAACDCQVKIVDYVSQVKENSYNFGYSLDDGQTRKESGSFQVPQPMRVSGEYSFKENGLIYLTTYVADENGFRPEYFIIPEDSGHNSIVSGGEKVDNTSTETPEEEEESTELSEISESTTTKRPRKKVNRIKPALLTSLSGGGASLNQISDRTSYNKYHGHGSPKIQRF